MLFTWPACMLWIMSHACVKTCYMLVASSHVCHSLLLVSLTARNCLFSCCRPVLHAQLRQEMWQKCSTVYGDRLEMKFLLQTRACPCSNWADLELFYFTAAARVRFYEVNIFTWVQECASNTPLITWQAILWSAHPSSSGCLLVLTPHPHTHTHTTTTIFSEVPQRAIKQVQSILSSSMQIHLQAVQFGTMCILITSILHPLSPPTSTHPSGEY